MSVTARYADPEASLGVTNEVLDLQLRHRSVRKFIPSRPVRDDELAAIIAAAQSASTSSNLQSWSVVAIRDPERKARLAALANDQQFIIEAPLFLVWVADLGRARREAERAGKSLEYADYLEGTMIANSDTAFAAQNAVLAAESLGLGCVFVGAIRNQAEGVAKELSLPKHAIAPFGLSVGLPDPTEEADVKPRFPQEAILHHETFDPAKADSLIPLYNERLRGYNERYGMPGDWSTRVLIRLGDAPSNPVSGAMKRQGFSFR